jgi:Spy/CpxP family protein refolding chaperone
MVAAGAALAVFALSSNLSAQSTAAPTNPSPAPAASPADPSQGTAIPEAVKPLFEGITLTEAQSKQVASITNKHLAMSPSKSDSAGGMGAGAVDHKAAAAKELRTVLTPEQQKTFDENVKRLSPAWGKPGA